MSVPFCRQVLQRQEVLGSQVDRLPAGEHRFDDRWREKGEREQACDITLVLVVNACERSHRGEALSDDVIPSSVGLCHDLDQRGVRLPRNVLSVG